MKIISIKNILPMLMLLLWLPTSASTAEPESTDCATLLHSRCESCHYNSRFCQRIGQKSKRAWKRSIQAMVGHGAKLTDAEQQIVVDCLNTPPPAVQEYCKAP